MNIGSMQARGWELGLTWRDEIGKDFSYDLGLNLSAVRNKAIKFSGDGPMNVGGFNSDQIIRNEDGGLISRFYGYVADGLFQNMEEVYAHTDEHGTQIQPNAKPGDIRFKDLDHNGVLDANDKAYIGNPYPDLMMGLNIGMRYKSIDFSANFYGTFGNDIYNITKGRYSGAGGQNVWAGTLEKAWHGEGTSNDIPRLSSNDLNLNYNRVSSFYVEDGSYMRCKLLQIGYTLPKNGWAVLICASLSPRRIRLPLPATLVWILNVLWLTVLLIVQAAPSIPVSTTWLILIREHSCSALTLNFNS